jgi:hypothetical protein
MSQHKFRLNTKPAIVKVRRIFRGNDWGLEFLSLLSIFQNKGSIKASVSPSLFWWRFPKLGVGC